LVKKTLLGTIVGHVNMLGVSWQEKLLF